MSIGACCPALAATEAVYDPLACRGPLSVEIRPQEVSRPPGDSPSH